MFGVGVGILLHEIVSIVDETLYLVDGPRTVISTGAATAILAAIGGGMVTFSGFVFSFVILVVQFGSSAYSPRTVSYFLRGRVTQWILALFLVTITFSFVGLVAIGSQGREDFAATTTVIVSVVLLLGSLFGFVILMHSVGSRIRVDAVVSSIGANSRKQLAKRLSPLPSGASPAPVEAPELPDQRLADLAHYMGRNGQIVAIDVRRLARLARRNACTLDVTLRVGDAITTGTPVAMVVGADRPLDSQISRALIVDVERSLLHDPFYALRLLVDIAIRALSPAINDPTTAVRAIDEIEAVLRTAATRRLGTVWIPVPPGTLVLEIATWEELVDLALLEILDSGKTQPQISRRLVALIDDLLLDLAEPRRAALRGYREALAASADSAFTGRAREVALFGDRQGLGGSG